MSLYKHKLKICQETMSLHQFQLFCTREKEFPQGHIFILNFKYDI